MAVLSDKEFFFFFFFFFKRECVFFKVHVSTILQLIVACHFRLVPHAFNFGVCFVRFLIPTISEPGTV